MIVFSSFMQTHPLMTGSAACKRTVLDVLYMLWGLHPEKKMRPNYADVACKQNITVYCILLYTVHICIPYPHVSSASLFFSHATAAALAVSNCMDVAIQHAEVHPPGATKSPLCQRRLGHSLWINSRGEKPLMWA